MKTALRKIIYTLIAIVLVFGGAEIVARLVQQEDAAAPLSPIEYQRLPDHALAADVGGRRLILGIVRGKQRSLVRPKPRGTFRVFVFGGSAAWGMGFPHNGAFADWFARMLELSHPERTIEVVNFASIGYSSLQVRALMDEVIAKGEPNLLVVYSGNNEFMDIKAKEAMTRLRNRRAARLPGLVETHLILARMFKSLLPISRKTRDEERRLLVDYLNIVLRPEQISFAVRRYERNLLEMAKSAHRNGTPIVICTLLANPLDNLASWLIDEKTWQDNPLRRNLFQAQGWARLGRYDLAERILEPIKSFGKKLDLLMIYKAGGIRNLSDLDEETLASLRKSCVELIPELESSSHRPKEILYPLALCYKIMGREENLSKLLHEVDKARCSTPYASSLMRAAFSQFKSREQYLSAVRQAWEQSDRQIMATPQINRVIRRAAASGFILADIEKLLTDWMEPEPSRYLLDYCHLNIEGAFQVARHVFDAAESAGSLPHSRTPVDFKTALLDPDLRWIREKGYDYSDRDRWMGLDLRVCFAYCQPHPRSSIHAEWAAQVAADHPEKEMARLFAAHRRYYNALQETH